jgi:hypothetical protein
MRAGRWGVKPWFKVSGRSPQSLTALRIECLRSRIFGSGHFNVGHPAEMRIPFRFRETDLILVYATDEQLQGVVASRRTIGRGRIIGGFQEKRPRESFQGLDTGSTTPGGVNPVLASIS